MNSETKRYRGVIFTEKINIKNKSNNDFVDEKYYRIVCEMYKKPLTLDQMNKLVTRVLRKKYENLHKIGKRWTFEFNFCARNDKSFGITDWFVIDPTLPKEEFISAISKIDINKTISLYEDEEKRFVENVDRNKFWITLRLRRKIGYGKGFCFFDALKEANVINITKNKTIQNNKIVYKYDDNIKSVYSGIISHIKNLNKLNESKNRTKEIIYIDNNGGIDINDMSKLEKLFKCNIFINSNNSYQDKYVSSGKFNKSVYLTFYNGHYELDKSYKPVFEFYDNSKLYNKEKLDLLLTDKNLYYDGKKYYENLDNKELSRLYKNKHIVSVNKLSKIYNSKDIKILYDLYKKDCEELEKYGIRLLNSHSLQKMIFQNLYLDIRYLNIKTERVLDRAEYEILNYRKQGGYNHVYKFDEIFSDVYSYDVKSSYPSVLSHPDFKIPIRKGDFKYIEPEKFKKYIEIKKDKNGFEKVDLQYGLYKCNISKSEKSDKFDEFIKSDHDVYTHFDILLAKKLGYNIELLNESIYPYVKNDNDKPFNCFVYSADKIFESNIIFRGIVKKYYDIKQKCKGNKIIKILSSGLWGNLCEDKTYYKNTVKKDKGSFTIEKEDNEFLLYTKPKVNNENEEIEYYYKKQDELTRTSLFRMKPFLLSFQRYLMYIEFIKKIEDSGGKILKIKVDGVYTDKKIEELEQNSEKEVLLDGDIVRDKHFDIILFKNKTYNLTSEKDIKDYLSKRNKKI